MLATAHRNASGLPAVVARIADYAADGPAYLRVSKTGESEWVTLQADATPFESMREATRQATRLPARLRAFGVPCRD